MRIVIASPTRSGNHWIKCLLGAIYGLTPQLGATKPILKKGCGGTWVAQVHFPDDCIFHTHTRFSSGLCDALEAVPAHIVTIVRDPYDVFVSYYFWAQQRVTREPTRAKLRTRQCLVGKPLDHPDVIAFLREEFGSHIRQAERWLHSRRAIVVRYEGLHSDPLAALTRVTGQLAPVPTEQIARAIEECRAETMRQRHKQLARTIRVATVGDSRDRLVEAHLAIFRQQYADLIRSLGYAVR